MANIMPTNLMRAPISNISLYELHGSVGTSLAHSVVEGNNRRKQMCLLNVQLSHIQQKRFNCMKA